MIIELRQYTLHPGRRDELIELFDRYFVDGQEACGMRVAGQFRDGDDPNRFVWLRAFRDMPARAEGLKSFYGGPLWQTHRSAANATMIDSDNVLLLRPVDDSDELAPVGAALFVAHVYLLTEPAGVEIVRFFESEVAPIMAETGAPPMARLVTEYAPNNFPALPVRAGEHAFVWLAAFATPADYERHVAKLAQSPAWNETARPELLARLASPPQILRLVPTDRSQLGHGAARGAR